MIEVKYDPDVLRAYAKVLYDRAEKLVFWSTARWAVVGVAIGLAGLVAYTTNSQKGYSYERHQPGGGDAAAVAMMGVLFGLVGRSRGDAAAWMIRLQAQQALCQLQVEINTRKG